MAPLVAKIGKLARDTNAAIILIHHRGKGENHAYRGSTAIGDQSDAVAILSRKEGNLRRLTYKGGKPPRYAPEPDDFFCASRRRRVALSPLRLRLRMSSLLPTSSTRLRRRTALSSRGVWGRNLVLRGSSVSAPISRGRGTT